MISSTLSFLKQLKSNNNRNWFNENKAKYLDVKKDLIAFNNSIFNSLSESEHLDYVKMFRIYRDTRFSKNKEPYKNHIGKALTSWKCWRCGACYEDNGFVTVVHGVAMSFSLSRSDGTCIWGG